MYRLKLTMLVALAIALVPVIACGQVAYPSRPIRMIVPFAPGGASDVVARIITQRLSELLGQQIIIDNRVGASGNIGMEAAAKAAPDGHTIYLGNIGTIAINPAIYRNLAVNPQRDFVPVTLVVDVPSVLITHPDSGAKTVAELVALAKANPGGLNFASTGSGALSRLEMEHFRKHARVDVVHIPYKGGAGPAVTAMLGGETHAMFVTLASAISLIQGGKLRALGISTVGRIDALPQVPTMAEAGFPDMTRGAWQGIFVPVGTPRPIVDKLHAAIVATLASPDVRQRLVISGATVTSNASPDEFSVFVSEEIVRWGRVARESGATVD